MLAVSKGRCATVVRIEDRLPEMFSVNGLAAVAAGLLQATSDGLQADDTLVCVEQSDPSGMSLAVGLRPVRRTA